MTVESKHRERGSGSGINMSNGVTHEMAADISANVPEALEKSSMSSTQRAYGASKAAPGL